MAAEEAKIIKVLGSEGIPVLQKPDGTLYIEEVLSVLDDHALLNTLAAEAHYIIGTNAHAAEPTVPLFTTREIMLYPSEDCYVRFNGAARIQHLLYKGEWICVDKFAVTDFYFQRVTANGVLTVHAFG